MRTSLHTARSAGSMVSPARRMDTPVIWGGAVEAVRTPPPGPPRPAPGPAPRVPASRRSTCPRSPAPAGSAPHSPEQSGGAGEPSSQCPSGPRPARHPQHLEGQERQSMLDEQPHQPLGVEDELVPAGLLVPTAGGGLSRRAAPWPKARCPTGGPSPDDRVHAPHLRRALEDTQSPGQGVALVCRGQRRPADREEWRGGCLLPEPGLPTPDPVGGVCGGDRGLCGVGRASLWLIWREGPPPQEQGKG